jgi:hypothetical protein
MIKTLEIRSGQGISLTLQLNDASNGYVVEDIDGLDPVKATLVSTSFAQQDGSQYQSSRRESRNILLKLGLEPDWSIGTVSDLRKFLYRILMPKTAVDMSFTMDDGLEVDISGRVESFDSTKFTQEPSVDVSIMCFDPDFVDPETVIQSGTSTDGFDNTTLVYPGTVDTGFIFRLLADRSMSEFSIYHQAADGSIDSLVFQAPIDNGDVISISTVSGSKYATRTRGGVDTSILYGVSPLSSWIELTPGTNGIRIYAEGDPVPYTIQYSNRYGGL